MGTRTVRLDDETEQTLEEIRQATGLSISEVLKRGIAAFREELARHASQSPFDVYQRLDLGPGGYAIASSTDVRGGVREALRKKHRR
ncbi:MAG TPA: ribbon-helix-helix protein, CopG family [Vicinamibacteria bacterium]|nr:ribbon-helix-helix protein, CopG family [Vicinamibacteria bacterium]HXV65104.1 ribbon-helix-helix protein, CopG family [Vicinamibacteria bacterium]